MSDFSLRAIKGTKDGFNLYKYAKETVLQPILPVIEQWSKSLSYIYFFITQNLFNFIFKRKNC